MIARLTVPVAIDFTPELLARAFCEMNDEDQSQMFVEIAKIMATWPTQGREMQMYSLAKHLADCACSSDGAREFVQTIGSELR